MTTWPVFYSSHERGAAFVVGAVATTARTIAATTHRADATCGAPTAGARGWACSRNGARSEEPPSSWGTAGAVDSLATTAHGRIFKTCIIEEIRTRQRKEDRTKKKQETHSHRFHVSVVFIVDPQP